MTPTGNSICVSIVSHCQSDLVIELITSLSHHCQNDNISLIITKNIPEASLFTSAKIPFPHTIIDNKHPKGYGANHNQAFLNSYTADFFCVLNPDIIFTSNPFPALLSILKNRSIGLAAPALYSSSGELQDSARRYPTIKRILLRRIRRNLDSYLTSNETIIYPDWVAGMFMLFPTPVFDQINGFNEQYFMYC